MKLLFTEIRDKLEAVTGMKYVRMWNDQLTLVDKGKMQMFPMPAAFIAFNSAEIMQLGEGVQLMDPLYVDIHILHWQVDAGDGTFEQNLDVFDFRMETFKKLQKFTPTKAGAMIRIAERQDYDHAGVYHYIQTYKFNLTEDEAQEPIDGVEWAPIPMPLELQVITQPKQDAAVPYDPLVQYLAVNQNIVRYLDVIYVIFADTPSPAGAFDITKWTRLEPNIYSFTPTA